MPSVKDQPRCTNLYGSIFFDICSNCSRSYNPSNTYSRFDTLCPICSMKEQKRIEREKKAKRFEKYAGVNVGLFAVLRRRLSSALNRSFRNARNIPHGTITMKQLINLYEKQKGCCALTGRGLKLGPVRAGLYEKDSLSIDRIDPKKGYEIENIQLVTVQVNIAKGRENNEGFIQMCKEVLAHLATTEEEKRELD